MECRSFATQTASLVQPRLRYSVTPSLPICVTPQVQFSIIPFPPDAHCFGAGKLAGLALNCLTP
jgi:hypothetical protein